MSKLCEMIAIDILGVPTSFNGNQCSIVVQDHFTKWADAIHFANQKANTIVKALVNLFAHGLPDIVHRDQEQVFEVLYYGRL